MGGGERKSHPRDAATIDELARTRPGLSIFDAEREIDVDIRFLIGRCSEPVQDQTCRLARLRDLLSLLFPALERRIDVTSKTGLAFLSLHATPRELRPARADSVAKTVIPTDPPLRSVLQLAEGAIALAKAQQMDVPGAATRARLVRHIAAEALAAREGPRADRPQNRRHAGQPP